MWQLPHRDSLEDVRQGSLDRGFGVALGEVRNGVLAEAVVPVSTRFQIISHFGRT